MRAMVTGMHGAVAPYVERELGKRNINCIFYDRDMHNIMSYEDNFNYIRDSKIDYFLHFATGPIEWVENISRACRELDVKLIYISTCSVYENGGTGPYSLADKPEPNTDYGRYKLRGEELTLMNKKSLVLRLGWQIGYSEGSNNMLDHLIKEHRAKGFIEASSKWFPSCGYLKDTAVAVADLLDKEGIYLINSNSKYSYYEIVNYLNNMGMYNWNIMEDLDFKRDDRMIDPRVNVNKLKFN